MLTIENYFKLKPKTFIEKSRKVLSNKSAIVKSGLSNLYFAITQLPQEQSTTF